jgi:hypothetical protein
MLPRYEEIVLTDSAYRHGFSDGDVAEMSRGRRLIIRSRRGPITGYEVFGRNAAGPICWRRAVWYNGRMERRCCGYSISIG